MNHQNSRLMIVGFLSLTVVTHAFSQQVYKATLHFPTDEYRLTPQQEKYLDSFAATLQNIPNAYRFTVSGHTDSVGTSVYNNTLSYNRAMSVAFYLERQGFTRNAFKLEAKGFSLPIANNRSEDNKERNRRVEVVFRLSPPQIKSIAGVNVPAEHHELDENGGIIETPTGTKISVPQDAFVDAKGKPVKGKVDIVYKEYRDPLDFLLSDIPMHFNNGREAIPFNSAGMFTITASQQNNPVYLQQGKRVNVGFKYDGTVRDVSLYRYDESMRRWISIQQMNQSLLDPFSDYMLWRNSCAEHCVCAEHPDMKQVFFVRTGLRYSSPSDSTIYKLYEAVRLYDQQQITLDQQKRYKLRAAWMLRKYKIDVQKKFLAKMGFKLMQIRGKRDKSSEMMDAITFRKDLSKTMADSLEQLTFDDYAIQRNEVDYSLVLYKGSNTVTVDHVLIRPDESSKRFDADGWLTDLNKKYKAYKTSAELYKDTARSFEYQVAFFKSQMDIIFPVRWPSWDSISCFRSMHDKWLSDDVKSMSLADWLIYYNGHKDAMAAIYNGIRQTDTYAAIEKKVLRYRNLRYMFDDPVARLELTSAELQMPGNFSLSTLGTYNCDQLQRLEDPITLYVRYTNQHGKDIKPVIALLIDSKLNGILRYDGANGLSPYHIAYSPKSISRMVLIDAHGEAYLVKPEAFAGVDVSLNKESLYTFVAEPIARSNNKEELRSRLGM